MTKTTPKTALALLIGGERGKWYILTRLEGGWRLSRPNKSYDVYATEFGLECSCPDCVYRERECKHARALREMGLI